MSCLPPVCICFLLVIHFSIPLITYFLLLLICSIFYTSHSIYFTHICTCLRLGRHSSLPANRWFFLLYFLFASHFICCIYLCMCLTPLRDFSFPPNKYISHFFLCTLYLSFYSLYIYKYLCGTC